MTAANTAGRLVPTAVRPGRRTDSLDQQRHLASAIYRDHVLCAVGMAVFLVVLLVGPHYSGIN